MKPTLTLLTALLLAPLAVTCTATERGPVLETRDGTLEPFARDTLLFNDRNYKLLTLPPVLEGMKFLRASMTRGQSVRCVEPGVLYALSPLPDHPRAASQQEALVRLGFVRVETPVFQLYGKEAVDTCAVYRKEFVADETVALGKWAVLLGGDGLRLVEPPAKSWHENDGELLYNGIRLPKEWPPRDVPIDSLEPQPVPYLVSPPKVIPIDVGRQLFVDDFLIERTTLRREFHHAVKYEGNPVLKPETPLESLGGGKPEWRGQVSSAALFDDAVFYDPRDSLFKMWIMGGMNRNTLLVTSRDGLHWERPELGQEGGGNCVIAWHPDFMRDGFTPWLDLNANTPAERYKAFLNVRTQTNGTHRTAWLYTSPDGIRWQQGPELGVEVGDNTTIFYNPFRNKWVMSVREGLKKTRGRVRFYFEAGTFAQLAAMKPGDPVFWAGADRLDAPDPVIGRKTQLYCLNAIAYESIMLGAFSIHSGPENPVCEKGNFPKLTQIKLGFSRDGFHWSRPDRSEFIAATQRDGDWDRAYLRPAGSVCTIVGDRIYFYYCGFSGIAMDGSRHMYAGGSTHVAFLRRDGFASMNARESEGELVTRPVTFKGSHLFVNANATNGELRVELLDQNGKVIEPFTKENCVVFSTDKTRAEIRWNGAEDISVLRDKPVRFRFYLRNGSLFSFWVSPEKSGASHGYVAAGGPGFPGATDTTGN
jgi:hypothetical protein